MVISNNDADRSFHKSFYLQGVRMVMVVPLPG